MGKYDATIKLSVTLTTQFSSYMCMERVQLLGCVEDIHEAGVLQGERGDAGQGQCRQEQ